MKDWFLPEDANVDNLYHGFLRDFSDTEMTFAEYLQARQVVAIESIQIMLNEFYDLHHPDL